MWNIWQIKIEKVTYKQNYNNLNLHFVFVYLLLIFNI